MTKKDKIVDKVEAYYTEKVNQHGATSQGVDWNGIESHELRFEMLSRLFSNLKEQDSFSLIDYGSGYGQYLKFIHSRFSNVDYTGFDISESMLEHAKDVLQGYEPKLVSNPEVLQPVDYVIANGLLNVKIDVDASSWEEYVEEMIKEFDRLSTKGFAFNILTSYSDEDKRRPHLYYADPTYYFDLCKKLYSRNVALLHDYDLYEFTIIVRKDL